jgi:Calx-beta domain
MRKPRLRTSQVVTKSAKVNRFPLVNGWLRLRRHWDHLMAWARQLAEAAGQQAAGLFQPGFFSGIPTRRRSFNPQLEILELRTLPSVFGFSQSNYAGVVGGPESTEVTVTVKRAGSTVGPATVDYASSDNTASAGVDYTAVSGELDYANGQSLATFSVTIYENDSASATMTYLMLNLSNPSGGTVSSKLGTASVTIVNETVPPSGSHSDFEGDGDGDGPEFAFTSTTYSCDDSD